MDNEKKRITPFPLRLQPELRKVLESSASENSRSLNAEIMHILSGHFDIEQIISKAIETKNPEIQEILKAKMSELFDDLLKEKDVIVIDKSNN